MTISCDTEIVGNKLLAAYDKAGGDKGTILCLYEASFTFATLYKYFGYKTVSVDILLGSNIFEFDYKQYKDVVGIISHPPCTHFSIAGAVHWNKKTNEQMAEAKALVNKVLEIKDYCKPKFWFIENPIGRILEYVPLGRPRLKFHPWEYAGWLKGKTAYTECYTKCTQLWGDFNIPEKRPIPGVTPSTSGITGNPRAVLKRNSKYERSKTPLGFAVAFTKANLPCQ